MSAPSRSPLPRAARSHRTAGPLLAAAAGLVGATATWAAEPAATTAQRLLAVGRTAASSTNACGPIKPFYWQIGDRSGVLGGAATGDRSIQAGTAMNIASASKWMYGAYAVERRQGALTANDVAHLHFTSGYTSFRTCLPGETVGSCDAARGNDQRVASTIGHFYYNGGHLQHHGVLLGLGKLDNAGLAAEMRRVLGTDIRLSYSQPQLAGGIVTTANDYGRFLRKLLTGQLLLGQRLGRFPVCTNPSTCPSALATPVPRDLSWHYSLAHWVEDDPETGDGAYSSAGAFGFYPWIDAGRTHWGVLARKGPAGSGDTSAACGRLLRRAWLSGRAG